MTGPAQRGYVVTGSTYSHFPSSGDTDAPWRSFDGITGDNAKVWKTYEMYTPAGVYSPGSYGRTASSITDTNSTQHSGEYLVLETPHKIKLSSWEVRAEYAPRRIVDYAILGSDTNSSDANKTGWTLLTSGTFAAQTDVTATVSSPTTAFKYHAIVVKSVTNNGDSRRSQVHEMKLYGTGVDSVPIQIGGGNIDKVANFRVYDKFVGEDQALEIWDAQKDEFRGVKNSVTLHKGRLGIGTTEPQGRLAVLDEPNTFEPRWPPKPLVGYNTHIEGYGEFVVHRSGNESTGEYRGNSWYIFDDNQNTFSYTYHGERDINDPINSNYSYFKGTNGEYTGGNSIGGILGDWTVLESPKPIKINDIIRMRVRSAGQATTGFIIAAANKFDGVWTKLTEQSNLVWQIGGDGESKTFHFENDTYYKYYAIIITRAPAQYGYPTLSNMEFSGIVQQGQSVLHDGQLTLTKSLTVPRIGPALDADDTPRRDRLVVEYNTSTNPTFEGAVRDTSGRGFHGALFGGAYYDANEKALRFDGSGDYTEVQLPSHQVKGEWIHSVSCWVKADIIDGEEAVWNIGDRTGQASSVVGSASTLAFNNLSPTLRWYFYNADAHTSNFTVATGQWYHITCVYTGGVSSATSQTIYVNGVEYAFNIFAGTGGALNFDANRDRILMLGRLPWGTASDLDGSISNFKLWDTALTAEEVKTLYDMGRCDEGHHVVNFSKTRVGIGLGDGEAPRGALDVRGDAFFSGLVSSGMPAIFGAVNNANYVQQSSISQNISVVHFSQGPNMKRAAGGITLPIAGMYIIQLRTHCWYSGGGVEVIDQHSFERYTASGTIYNSANRGTIHDVQTGGTSGNSDMHHVSTIFIHANAGDYVIMTHGTSPSTTRNYNNEWNYISAACVYLDEPQFSS
jgi:hypothetical protein